MSGPTSTIIQIVPIGEGVVMALCRDGSLWTVRANILGWLWLPVPVGP
jgi:hypothetical protein